MNNDIKKRITTEKGITYELKNDRYYPALELPEQPHYEIGKYGRLHLKYLKEHRCGTYATLLTEFRLNEYLHEVDVKAKEMVSRITAELAQNRGVTEALKVIDQMRWVREMNNCSSSPLRRCAPTRRRSQRIL